MKRKKNLPYAAAHTAAERSADLRDSVVATLAPLLEQAQENLGPIAKDTKKRGAAFAATALDKAQPGINGALDKVTPSVDAARVHVQDNLIPKLSEVLHTAAELPTIAAAAATAGGGVALEASKKELKKANKRARKQAKLDAKAFGKKSKKAQKQALAQLHDLAPAKKSNTGRNAFVGIIFAAGMIAGVVYALKKFLGTDDEAGWAAHEPSTAYTQDTHTAGHEDHMENDAASEGMVNTTPTPDRSMVSDATLSEAENMTQGGGADEAFTADEHTVNHDASEPRPFSDAAETEGVGRDHNYGEGAFVGENPPAGFFIKGNERSMKYHVQGSGGFDRTIADVWFNSEEAAQAAGFTRAQR